MAFSPIDLVNRGPQPSDCRDTMHVSMGADFKIPRASRVLRAAGGVMLMAMTDGTFAVGCALREGAEVGRLTPIFETREQADFYFDEQKEIK